MKKVLTVLLAIAVVFTFSFGSAFADSTKYEASDYETKLQAQKTTVMGYLATAKAQALGLYDFNDEGFTALSNGTNPADGVISGYSKDALTAAADAVIADIEDAIDDAISDQLAKDIYPTSDDVDKNFCEKVKLKDYSNKTVAELESKTEMQVALESKMEDLEKAQAPLTKKAVNAKLDAVDLSKYNSKDKDYFYKDGVVSKNTIGEGESKLTAADAVQAIIDDAKDAIADADKLKKGDKDANNNTIADTNVALNAAKRLGYEKAYEVYKSYFDIIDTLADEDFNDIGSGTDLDKALNAYVQYGYNQLPTVDKQTFPKSDATVDWSDNCKTNGIWEDFWDGTTKTSKDGTLFDVAIKNYKEVTRSEAIAVYNAMKKNIDDSKKVVEAWANAEKANKTNVPSLYTSPEKFFQTLRNAMDAADTYADVVKEGGKLKAEYNYGVKQYDDAKVEEAVKNAESFVYGDLNEKEFAKPLAYIIESANDLNDNSKGLTNLLLEEAKNALTKFMDALDDAAEKMFEDGFEALDRNNELVRDKSGVATAKVTKKVSYGSDKTAEADLVYLQGTYANSEKADWTDTAEDTLQALLAAQSYDEINSIMKKAAEEFGKLLKEDDRADVEKARDAYIAALPGFIKQNYELLDDQSDYSKAYKGMPNAEGTPLYTKGVKKINDANTVDAVKAAYAEAQALVTGAKSDDQLKDMKKAIEKKINDLPVVGKLTVDDRDAVKTVYAEYADYIDLAGAEEINNKVTLKSKYDKVNELLADALDKEAEALLDKMDDVDYASDADYPKYIAYKEEAKALIAKGDALQDDITDVNDDKYITLETVTQGKDYKKIENSVNLDFNYNNTDSRFYDKEIRNAETLLIAAAKPDATAEQMKAALDAYNALTLRQQLKLDNNTGYYLELAKRIADKVDTTVKGLKITAKSTAKKGSITVTWTVKGSADIDGYEVWKSTKHSKGYKKAFTTKKQTYKNTKGLKKGTRYYYKVRAYKMVEGKKITSDWSNKARRVAK